MSGTKKNKWLWVLLGVALTGGCGIVLCLAVVSFLGLMAGGMSAGVAPVAMMTATNPPGEEPAPAEEPTVTMVSTSPPGIATATAIALAPAPPRPSPTPETLHQRIVEVEWPPRMRLGDSDIIRLSFIPSPEGGYIPTIEFEEHEVVTTAVPIPAERFERYYVYATANLHAVGFDVEPGEFPPQEVLIDQPTSWRWSIKPRQAGEHRINLSLVLRWEPRETASEARASEQLVWSDSLSITVTTTLGLNARQADLLGTGGSILGGILGLPFGEEGLKWAYRRWRGRRREG